MARRHENGKGFLIIEVSADEMADTFGSPGICDYCGSHSRDGYLIAVLNCWYCPECFNSWVLRAKRYPQDKGIEERNYGYYEKMLVL